jgi:hypothetical protein
MATMLLDSPRVIILDIRYETKAVLSGQWAPESQLLRVIDLCVPSAHPVLPAHPTGRPHNITLLHMSAPGPS